MSEAIGGPRLLPPEQIDTPEVKLADTVSGVHPLIRARWSPRAFSDREVSNQDLERILDAARWAASSYNEQPWRFFVVRKSDGVGYEKFLDLLMPVNQGWAKHAPVLIITAAKKNFSHNNSPNHYALHDTGQALANFFLEATALGLHAHGMGGFDHERARKELNLPDDYYVGAAVALGYVGSPDHLAEGQRKIELAPRTRKPLSEIAFGESWNQPLEL
jgi:nitroreductase